MSAARWLCKGGIQPVTVVHGDGQMLSVFPPVKVSDIIDCYPHQYICHMSPEVPSNKSAMLPLDCELEPGYVYFLLPLPRLFPTAYVAPPACCCRSNHERSSEFLNVPQRGGFSPLNMKQIIDRIGSPLRAARKKVAPVTRCSPLSQAFNGKFNGEECSPLLSPVYGTSKRSSSPKRSVSPQSFPNRLWENANARNSANNVCSKEIISPKWKPGLGCISETDVFGPTCEEVRLCLERRRLTFDCRVRSNNFSLRLSDVCKSPSRDSKSQKGFVHDMSTKDCMPMAGYVFV